jgi:DNA-directed RNA polymerase subunit omega
MSPPVEDLLEHTGSKFMLVSLAAKRGRQINQYFSQLGEGLGSIVPPQVTSVARKPLSIAFEEIAASKILATELQEEPELSVEAFLENDELLLGESEPPSAG